jgi:hypothetical protein
MEKHEVARLLAAVAATDNRTVGKLDVETWAQILPADMALADAMGAVVAHRRTSTEWLMPKHIIDSVAAIRRERLTRAGTPPIPGNLSWHQEKEWRQLWSAKVKDGATSEQAAAQTSIAMRIHELPAVEDAVAVEAIATFARARSIPKAERPKPPRYRWGPWVLGHHNDSDDPVYGHVAATTLFCTEGYGIPLEDFATPERLAFWVQQIGGKGWGTKDVVHSLERAFWDLHPEAAPEAAAS